MKSKIVNRKSKIYPEPGRRVYPEPGRRVVNLLTGLALFLLALLPRAYDLPRFVTADEAKWIYRSAQFLAAWLQGDYAATSVNLTPAVTTTWLGSLGLALYYRLHQAAIGLPLTDWLLSLPEFRAELDILVAARWPMVVMTSLAVAVIYWLARRLFNPALALIAATLIALDPHTIALSRILGHDAPAAMFMTLALLLLLLAVYQAGERPFDTLRNRSGGAEEQGSGGAGEISPLFLRPSAPLLVGLPVWLFSSPILLLILSGSMAGLAFLSKAPALFLVPFAGLLFASQVWGHSKRLFFWFKRFLIWLVAAYLTFIVVWPAAWADPLGRPLAVVENAFLSATDQEEADSEDYWLVPDLGPFYYIVNGGFKLSPLVMVGAGLAIFFLARQQKAQQRIRKSTNDDASEPEAKPLPDDTQPAADDQSFDSAPFDSAQDRQDRLPITNYQLPITNSSPLLWLLAFSLLFTLFMTFGDKRSSRYILPAFPALSLVAACGWLTLYQVVGGRDHASRLTPHALRATFQAILILAALLILLPYIPYYFTYFNPLLGGAYSAPHLVKIGWGEGLDRVGRFLQRELPNSRVGTAYASTVAPFFGGDLSKVEGRTLDYLVLYRKQVQSGQPSPTFIRYFEQFSPIFSVELNGIHYADVYPGPAIQPALSLTPGLDAAILPKPLGFRPLTPYGHIGETLEIDVIWLADARLPDAPSNVTLEPLSAFDFSHEGHDHGGFGNAPDSDNAGGQAPEVTILAQGAGRLTRLAGDLVVSRHRLALPDDLPRDLYTLRVDGRPLGEIELRNFQTPANLAPVGDVVFNDQLAIRAYQFNPTEDYLEVTLAWQAQQSRLPDYTVFVQLLDLETNERLAGVDTQPLKGDWPTSRWVKGEVVVDKYFIAVPPALPPGFFKIIAGLYRPETGERLLLADGRDHWVVPWTVVRE